MTGSSDATERRQLTVMFTDLVGSTELASALDPEDWHDVLNAYQHRVAAIVTAHGGVIAQFQGDGAVAYFGYPEALESASRDALSAGIAIVEDIVRLGSELAPDLGIGDLQARVGIHTGEVLVAAVTAGGQERLPDVWGQVPNMAARLQASGEPGQIVVSGDTAELVAGFFELESLGSLTLKGIGHPVPAFRVLQRSSARHRLEARPLTAFIRRPEASAWLEQHWAHVESGTGRLILVSGEPGIGKSRLLLEFGSDLAARGHTVATVFCSRRGSLSPLQPFGEVMGEVPATPQEAAAWVEERARSRPVLLVVEDAHWADPSTLEAVHVIARGNARVLVLMSARPEIADDPEVQPDGQLTLDRLSTDEARGMLERLPEAAQLKPEVRAALVQRADGVPLFLEELARGLTDGSEVVGFAMPTTLSEVITARLDRVGEAKRVAQAAAVIGRSFDRPLLEAATGLEGTSLDARAADGCRSTPSSNRRRGPARCNFATRCSTRRPTVRSCGRTEHACTAPWARCWSRPVGPRPNPRSRHITSVQREGPPRPCPCGSGQRTRHARTPASGKRQVMSGRCSRWFPSCLSTSGSRPSSSRVAASSCA